MKLFPLTLLLAASMLAGCVTAPARQPPADNLGLARFHALSVDPVQFAPAIDAMMPAADRDHLSRDLRTALNDALPASARANAPAPGVLRVQIVVTELDTSSPTVNALTTALLFVPFDKGGVAFEARFFDSQSGAEVARATHRHISTPLELKGSYSRYGQAARVFREWGEDLNKSLAGER